MKPEPQASSPSVLAVEESFGLTRVDRKKVFARRSQLEMRMDMLKAVKQGAEKPTQIMYKANLCWAALQTNLKLLIEKGLLKWATEGAKKHYELTPEGRNVMYLYSKITEALASEWEPYTDLW
jgi:predicted transcriptional regulator